jgi:hypothetical protein
MGTRVRLGHGMMLAGIVVGMICFANPTRGALLAGWDFQTTANGGTAIASAPDASNTYKANFGISAGVATMYLNGTNGSGLFETGSIGNEVTGLGGTALNAGNGFSTSTSSPASLGLVNSTANTKSISIAFSMANHQDVVLSYATSRNASGFKNNRWSYSTNGSTWITFGTIIDAESSFSVYTLDLSLIPELDNDPTVWFRYTLGGATLGSGNARIDNVQLIATPTPEPAGVAVLGLGARVLLTRRRLVTRSK